MFTILTVSTMYGNKPHEVEVIGTGITREAAFETLRAHLLESNNRLLTHKDLPSVIATLAKASIENNATLTFFANDKGVVYINDIGPEMDYYYMVQLPA